MRRRRNTEMKKFRVLSSLLLGCLLLVITVQDSSARVVPAGQEGNKNKLEVTGKYTAMSAKKKDPFERAGAAHHMRKLVFGTLHHGDGKGADQYGSGGTSKMISGATYFDGICDSFERDQGGHKIVKCTKGEKKRIKPTRKLKMDGYVAFTTDDYHGPRHHLPKHN